MAERGVTCLAHERELLTLVGEVRARQATRQGSFQVSSCGCGQLLVWTLDLFLARQFSSSLSLSLSRTYTHTSMPEHHKGRDVVLTRAPAYSIGHRSPSRRDGTTDALKVLKAAVC